VAHDDSVASKMEDWIIAQVQAIQIQGQGGPVNIFEAAEVTPWVGTQAGAVEQFAKELIAGTRGRIVRVLYAADREVEDLADDQVRVFGQYWVLVGVHDVTNAAVARRGLVRGTETKFGTNLLRDLLRNALDQKSPAVNSNGVFVDRTFYRGATVVHLAENLCVMKAMVETVEVPAAT